MLRKIINFIRPRAKAESRAATELDWATGNDAIWSDGCGIDDALSISPVYRAVDLISSSVGKLPLNVYSKIEAGGFGKDYSHPANKIISARPNRFMPSIQFKKSMQLSALIAGNAYAYIERDEFFRPIALWRLDPDKITPAKVNGDLIYLHTPATGDQFALKHYDILHIHGLSWDGITGYKLTDVMSDTIKSGKNSKKYINKFFENGSRPSILIEAPGSLSDAAVKVLKKTWEDAHKGINNMHKTAILTEGMSAKQLSVSAKDAQLIEGLKWNLVDVANFFGLPPHKLGDSSRAAYNSLEAENQSYLDECLDSWLVIWEQELNNKLLTESEQINRSSYIEFNRKALVRADIKTRAEVYRVAGGGIPWMTVNEIRALEGMPSLGVKYDTIILPTNNFGSDINADTTRQAKKLVDSTTERMRKRLAIAADKAKRNNNFAEFCASIEIDHGRTIMDALSGPIDLYNRVSNDVIDIDNHIKDLYFNVTKER